MIAIVDRGFVHKTATKKIEVEKSLKTNRSNMLRSSNEI